MHSLRTFRHKPRLWLLALLALILASTVATCSLRSDSHSHNAFPGNLPDDEIPVFCQTVIHMVFPDRRLLAKVGHPFQGGIDALKASLTTLDQQGLPPKPWPDGWRFTTHDTTCVKTWEALFEGLSNLPFSRAHTALDPNAVPDEANYRQAALKLLYKEQYDVADKLYPRVNAPTMEE